MSPAMYFLSLSLFYFFILLSPSFRILLETWMTRCAHLYLSKFFSFHQKKEKNKKNHTLLPLCRIPSLVPLTLPRFHLPSFTSFSLNSFTKPPHLPSLYAPFSPFISLALSPSPGTLFPPFPLPSLASLLLCFPPVKAKGRRDKA